jgi:hypothetical protein
MYFRETSNSPQNLQTFSILNFQDYYTIKSPQVHVKDLQGAFHFGGEFSEKTTFPQTCVAPFYRDFEANPRAKTASTPESAHRPEQGKRSGD